MNEPSYPVVFIPPAVDRVYIDGRVTATRALIEQNQHDPEACHKLLDEVMEELLVELGFYEVVKLIRGTTRWYG